MEFTKESFDLLKKKNAELELQIKSDNEFSGVQWLNQSETISQVGSWSWNVITKESHWSDTMFRLVGLEPNQEIPSYQLALQYVHDDDKEAFESVLVNSMNNKGDYYFENRIVKEDKSVINVINRGVCICNEKNELIRIVGTVQDITHIKNILETNKQLEQFANVLSHDFKAPIRNIISFIELIKKRSFEKLTKDGKEYFQYIESATTDLSTLVNDILEYSKLVSPKLNIQTLHIKDLVNAVLLDLKVVIKEKNCSIIVSSLPEFINVDRIKMKQVFQNLILNAIKYTPIGINPEIEVYCEEDTDKFTFFVKDNGMGIEKKYTDKIFEPYERINDHKSFSGIGIGLSICKRIINMHKGKIGHLENKENGSIFFFTIPK